ncbi:MAG TPA: penicillin-binding transpeptidase domain-containing protein [Terriglobales bacterium]|nr:penicillin-binding transpeptidase domain-containing protein [Terriglobales bacterium]
MLKRSPFAALVLLVLLGCNGAFAATATTTTTTATTTTTRSTHRSHRKSRHVVESTAAKKKMARMKHSSARVAHRNRASHVVASHPRHRYYERFYASSYANDQVEGDLTAGEDPVVRAAAVEALGNMNGTIVAVNPDNGRILAMVNQKLALSAGAEPCSTIKIAVALAALSENIITKDTQVRLGKYWKMDLTTALAHSNNAYFAAVGQKLGFEKVSYYAHQFGLGELAGWNIPNEHLGVFPSTVLSAKLGGVGKMCSFGESISLTPLQLAALVGAIANGGTLYYLQHPTTPEEVANFTPKIKRKLDIGPLIPEISDGMAGAVEYGTARLLRTNFIEEPVLGKTGTCSNNGTRFGWFGSFANTQYGRIVVVVFLQGGRPTFGPKAAELAGIMYRNLYDHDFFAAKTPATSAQGSEPAGMSAPQ